MAEPTLNELKNACHAMHKRMDTINERLAIVTNDDVLCQNWRSEHDGRINELWRRQHLDNKHVAGRVTVLEKRVFWFSGAAAAFGAFLPQLLAMIRSG